jgi:hypothetical protein
MISESNNGAAYVYQDFRRLGFDEETIVDDFIDEKYPLDELINDDSDTILHLMVRANLTVEKFYSSLKSKKFTTIDPRNHKGQTPLELAARTGLQLHVYSLLFFGADLSKLQTEKFQVELIPRDMQVFIDIREALQCCHNYDSLLKIVARCSRDRIDLNGVFDAKNHNLLQILLLNSIPKLPSYVLDILLRNHQGMNVNQRNVDGQTALMLAASKSDQKSIFILLKHGADSTLHDNVGLTAEEYGKRNAPRLSFNLEDAPRYQTVYSKLIELIESKVEKASDEDTPKLIFECFLRYIQDAKWKYHPGDITYNDNVLDQSATQSYQVNCIGLSYALYNIFLAFGLTGFEIHHFIARDSADSAVIKMKYPHCQKCFDVEATSSMLDSFSNHCVILDSAGNCFDSTFSCIYAKATPPFDIIIKADAARA